MTMLSFRVGADDADDLERWADELGLDRSQILRDALHKHLVRLASEAEADTWAQIPLQDDELALQKIAAWGVAEDWAEWQHAAW